MLILLFDSTICYTLNTEFDMAVTDDPALMRLLTSIYEEKGLDFTQYKEPSLVRRLNSRLHKYNAGSYEEYMKILESHPEEYTELINALTINVTEFFRNPESFEAIEKIVMPRVIYSKHQHRHKIIRAWSCGCSSGDEPYSIAMLMLEKIGKARDHFLLTIIGSDIDDEALSEAKNMVYDKERLKAIDSAMLGKYFEKIEDGKFKLKASARALVRLRHHDIVKDHPFMHCDIILCRNLLIYFNKQLQEEVQLKFYEALNPGGFLVLGMVESLVGAAVNAFEHVNNRLRVYRKPEDKSLTYDAQKMLSQEDIDKVVSGMIERE